MKTEKLLVETEQRANEMQRDIDILNQIENKQNDKSEYLYGGAFTDSPRRGKGADHDYSNNANGSRSDSLSPSKVKEGEWSMVATSRTHTKSTAPS